MVLTLLCTFSTLAQNKVITVSGRVIENDSKEPAAQSTVQLLALPDSTFITGVACNNEGWFTLPKVKAGKYLLKVSYIGFTTHLLPLQLTNNVPDRKLGTIALEPDAVLLKEAVITAEAPQVTMKGDTLEYNSAAYRTPEGAMLEELVKKLPGAEVDDEGNIKINGKDVKKIMVDGKEFFGGDVKTGLKNLPVNMIDKLKTYDKKSDLARITGIDDGEEETVLDLKVKKGMNQGWFGNISGGVGTKDRYASNLMLNRFVDNSQFSLIGSANNVNDQGFYGGGGGGPRFRGNSNGLNATKMLGANFATQTNKIELGGSARYNYSDADATSIRYVERSMLGESSYTNSNSSNRNKRMNFNADFRLEWKPDTLTNIIFRPALSYGETDGKSISASGAFNKDPYGFVSNPNDYLDLVWLLEHPDEDPLRDVRLNASNNKSLSDGNSLSANASLQLNRRLNNKGRNITLRGTFSYGDSESDQFSDSRNHYYKGERDDNRKHYVASPTKNYDYSTQLTYSEPIARATFLQFSYRFQYRYSTSDKRTYDLADLINGQAGDWMLGDDLPMGYEENFVDSLSKYAQYKYYNHDIGTSLRFIREKYQLSVGVSFQPQNTKLDYKKEEIDTIVKRSVFNFSPNIDFSYRFSKQSQLRLNYRGRANQPGMENLLDITDNSNPLNIRKGNPGLKPSFNHSLRMFYNTYNVERQRGIMLHAFFSATQNNINNSTIYNETTGGVIVQPKNINGDWSASGGFGYNTAFKNNKKFTINTYSNVSYNNNVSYLYSKELLEDKKNTSTNLNLGERLGGTYRNDWFEFTVNGSINYNFERNKLNPTNNQEPYTYGYGASTNVFLPWNMSVSTNITNNSRRGYRDASMNRNELIWNAQIAQNFLKGKAATITFEIYDILKQQMNISRSWSDGIRSVSEYNGINHYCMLRFSYRLNVFGNKAARGGMRPGGFDGGVRIRGGAGGFGTGRLF